MDLPIFHVDAFTGELFRGNPAAVVILERWLPDETLQAIAAENNLAETAFVLPAGDRFGLRWFTPRLEIDLCGHATLASASVLFTEGLARGDRILFDSPRSGELSTERDGDLLALDFPARPAEPVAKDPRVASALGGAPDQLLVARDLLAVFDSARAVRALRPDFEALAALEPFATIVTAPGEDCDFVSRFFAPKAGIPEDPVTGSSHCTLVPYWSRRLQKKALRARQISERGGELICEDRGARIRIAGRAVRYMAGRIFV